MRHTLAGFLAALAVASVTLHHVAAQGAPPRAGAPRSAAAARTPDGKPDLRGFWNAPSLYNSNILEEHVAGFGIQAGKSVVINPSDGKIPYQPWALAQRDEHRKAENAYLDNEGRCVLSGMPRIMLFSFETRYVGNDIVMLFDYVHTTRTIHMDRRAHIPGAILLWLGDSVGYWEGDTLVVDTTNLNGKFWFALGGDFATDSLHIVERFNLSDANTLQWQATLTDPKAYTRPWTMRLNEPYTRGTAEEFLDDSCHEGNVDLAHLKNSYDQARAAAKAGASPARAAIVPTGPGKLTGKWTLGDGGARRPSFHSEIVLNHTADRLEFQSISSRVEPTYAVYRLDGSEAAVEAPPGIKESGRASVEGEKIAIATKRVFSSPAGDVVAEIRDVYSVSGDALVVERSQVVNGEASTTKATYRRAR